MKHNLCRELESCLVIKEGMPPVVRHPLLVTLYFGTKMESRLLNEALERKKEEAAEARRLGNWDKYVWLHDRPFRLDTLIDIMNQMPDQDYWAMLCEVWMDSEGPGINRAAWVSLFTERRGHRDKLMSLEDQSFRDSLPDEFTIYRGGESPCGLSWTTDIGVAEWFSRRFNETCVWQATIKKTDALAFFTGKGEWEVVVNLPDGAASKVL